MQQQIFISFSIHELKTLIQDALEKTLRENGFKFREEILNLKEAAEFLDIAPQTIYALRSRNEIPAIQRKGSSKLYFKRSELEAWIENKSINDKTDEYEIDRDRRRDRDD